MEHLPLPRDPLQPCPTIPLYSEEPYDKQPFLDYLIRHPGSIFLDDDGPGLIYEKDVRAHYQRWLFFGLLHEFLGGLYEPNEFIRYVEDVERAYLSTISLRKVTAKWFAEDLGAVYERDPSFSHFAKCLDEVAKMLNIASSLFPGHSVEFGLQLDAIASVAELFESQLGNFHEIRGIQPRERFRTDKSWLYCSFQTKREPHAENCNRMRAAGWCPNDINRAYECLNSVEAWHYFRHLRLGLDSDLHADCDYAECKVINVKKGTNVTEHWGRDCSCDHFYIGSDLLTQIYQTGRIPCLAMTFRKGASSCPGSLGCLEDLTVSVTNLALDDPDKVSYTAISHVWSDGMGNTEANALPYCQLERLFEAARSWSHHNHHPHAEGEPIYVWVDTLLCPFEQGEGKQLALSRMKEIYSNAAFTLVFDKSLRSWDATAATTLECAVRLFLSPWMRRLWTAQEAILASIQGSLVVNYSRSSLSINYLISQLFSKKGSAGYSEFGAKLSIEMVHLQKGVWFGSDELPPHDNMLALLSNTLRWRSASVASDESLVVATLLGLNAEDVLDINYEEAMCRIWVQIPGISGGLSKYAIFARTPKLATPGFRWAPRSFLDSWSHNLTKCFQIWTGIGYLAQTTSRGLVAAYPGILFRSASDHSSACIFGRDNDQCEQDADQIIFEMPDKTWGVTGPTYGDNHKPTNAAVKKYIRAQFHEGNLALLHPDSEAGPSERQSLIVGIEEITDELIFASAEHTVDFTKLRNDSCQLATVARECAFSLIAKSNSRRAEHDEVDGSADEPSTTVDALVNQHVLRIIEGQPTIRDIINAENKKSIHDKPDLDMNTIVAKFSNHVHYFGHLGKFTVEVLPEDQKWCIG